MRRTLTFYITPIQIALTGNILILILPFFLSCSPKAASYKTSSSNDTFVAGNVYIIKQPKGYDCWASVTTMLYSWRDEKRYKIKDVLKQIGEPWLTNYKANKGLSYAKKRTFIEHVGFKSEPPANYTIRAYKELLIEHGPLWITTYAHTSNSTTPRLGPHAILLIGIESSEKYETTNYVFIDPLQGKVKKQTAFQFETAFEQEAKRIVSDSTLKNVDFRIQIVHW